jgi:hypothetical protein
MTLLLLGYAIHPEADAAEYEQWLRDVDCPFWNGRPGVRRYENWKVSADKVGELGFPYFDLIWLEEGETFESVMGHAEAREFAGRWVQRWGVEPDAEDPARNFRAAVAELVAAPAGTSRARRA